MKRMSLDGIYVQKKDILSIYSIYGIFPARLTDKIFPEGFDKQHYNMEEYVLINEEIDINTINSFEWIVDYDELYGHSLEELREMVLVKTERSEELHDKFVNMSKDLRSDEFVREIKSLDYEIQGIKDVILEKERNLRFNIDDNEDLKR